MIFISRVSVANLSLQYVNSMNCMVISRVGVSWRGGGVIWMAYDAYYVRFEPSVAMTSLGITCTWK